MATLWWLREASQVRVFVRRLSVDVSECRINVVALYREAATCASRQGLSPPPPRLSTSCLHRYAYARTRVAAPIADSSSTATYRDTVTITETVESSQSRRTCAPPPGRSSSNYVTIVAGKPPTIFRRDRRESKNTPARGNDRSEINPDVADRYRWISAALITRDRLSEHRSLLLAPSLLL